MIDHVHEALHAAQVAKDAGFSFVQLDVDAAIEWLGCIVRSHKNEEVASSDVKTESAQENGIARRFSQIGGPSLAEELRVAIAQRDDARRGQCILQQRWLVCEQQTCVPLRAIAADWWGEPVADALFRENEDVSR